MACKADTIRVRIKELEEVPKQNKDSTKATQSINGGATMPSIKIDPDQVECVEAHREDDGGTVIVFKNGHCVYVEKAWTIILKETSHPIMLIEI